MIDTWEAQLVAAPWIFQDKPVGAARTFGMYEFDLGYVFWRVPAPEESADPGAGAVVVDRHTGELTRWPAAAVEATVRAYRSYRRQTPASPLTWDPVARARRERARAPFPAHRAHLRLADGREQTGRSMKGDGEPDLHRLVREVLDRLPPQSRTRGGDRCAEVAALSDQLHAEDARRAAIGEPALSAQTARTDLLYGAQIATYRIREATDPQDGTPAPPCASCRALLADFGLALPAATEQRP